MPHSTTTAPVRCAVLSELPGYVITSDGRVQGPGRWGKPVWLRPSNNGTNGSGYLYVCLDDGTKRGVHTLVCAAFRGPKPGRGYHAAHLNGVKTDNRAVNLAWRSPGANERDKVLHGTGNQGERHGSAVLTEEIVREIRRDHARGASRRFLALRHGVGWSTVNKVVKWQTWRHLSHDGG
ncbi:HNH endonuclease [Streptomyces sp. NPDC003077]|uniref:HNH endonuclease n=1 Tax=Streptomyces sp. NPDC003077 TaxID=3154443 RepID=UPI0033BE5E7F